MGISFHVKTLVFFLFVLLAFHAFLFLLIPCGRRCGARSFHPSRSLFIEIRIFNSLLTFSGCGRLLFSPALPTPPRFFSFFFRRLSPRIQGSRLVNSSSSLRFFGNFLFAPSISPPPIGVLLARSFFPSYFWNSWCRISSIRRPFMSHYSAFPPF